MNFEEVWCDEVGLRAVRLQDRLHHLQLVQQTVPIRFNRHGQSSAQVHRVQRTTRVTHKQKYYRRELSLPQLCSLKILQMCQQILREQIAYHWKEH